MSKVTENKPLLPGVLTRPGMLLWTIVLPMLLLGAYYLRTWLLVRGEVAVEQAHSYAIVFASIGTTATLAAAASAILRKRQRPVGKLVATVLFVVLFGFTWIMVVQIPNMIPDGVAPWMLTHSQLLFAAFAASSLGMFYSLMHLAGAELPLSPRADLGSSILVMIGIPGFWYLLVQVPYWLRHHFDGFMPMITVFLFLTTAVMLCAFIRILLYIYTRLGRSFVLMLLGALAFPLAGLALNAAIPFPCNLQDWRMYALTLLNAAAVLVPAAILRKQHRLPLWCIRTAMYPFSLYFFLLFLPFLPLAIPAMIAAGSGFLILAPTFLFIVHTRLLISEFHLFKSAGMRTAHLLALFIAMLMVIPTAYTGRAILHKSALMKAVDLVYHPDYRRADVLVNESAVRQALTRLDRMKSGIYVPILSDYYNSIVFDGMVLPDRKMQEIRSILLDEHTADTTPRRDFELIALFTGGRSQDIWTRRAPPRTVTLSDVTTTNRVDQQLVRTEIVLTMQNADEGAAEFITSIELPDGALVTGYWLEIEGRREPGYLFDRKAAEWVYHMIRDTTVRDPGLLVYKEGNRLQLNVYPFSRNQTRQCAIEVTYPANAGDMQVQVGARTVLLSDGAPGSPSSISMADDLQALHIPANSALLPSIRREVVPHFIVDASASALTHQEEALTQLRAFLSAHEPSRVQLTLANAGSRALTPDPINATEAVSKLKEALADESLYHGGFNAGRALCRATLNYADSPELSQSVPLFVLITSDKEHAAILGDPEEFQRLKPDTTTYLFAGDETASALAAAPVHLLRAGAITRAVPAERSSLAVLGAGALEVFDPAVNGFRPFALDHAIAADTDYARGLLLWHDYRKTRQDPATADAARGALLAMARRSKVLFPGAAYIVLENSAQREMLKRAEKQALSADSAFEFDEFDAPAPPTILLLLAFLIYQYASQRRQSRKIAP